MNIEELTLKQIREIAALFPSATQVSGSPIIPSHPMLGRRCLLRTYSAGVHIGTIEYINPSNAMEVKLNTALRLWKWEGGGLSLSDVASKGIKGGRLNKTGEVFLTNVIEIIPTTELAEKSYEKFIE